jgi:hypothetical protein
VPGVPGVPSVVLHARANGDASDEQAMRALRGSDRDVEKFVVVRHFSIDTISSRGRRAKAHAFVVPVPGALLRACVRSVTRGLSQVIARSSTWEFCIDRLGMSEGETSRRLNAVKLARRLVGWRYSVNVISPPQGSWRLSGGRSPI